MVVFNILNSRKANEARLAISNPCSDMAVIIQQQFHALIQVSSGMLKGITDIGKQVFEVTTDFRSMRLEQEVKPKAYVRIETIN